MSGVTSRKSAESMCRMFSAQDAGLTIDLPMHDNCRLVFGDGDDLYMAWDGTDFDIVPASSGSGIVFGAASYGLGVNVGVFSSLTAGSGYPLATATPGALKVYSDDAGASIADSVRGVLSRTLLTVDQAGASIRALMGQLKLKTGADVQTGIYTGVQGYVEMAGTHSAKTGSTLSCVDASAEIGTALTVDSGGEFFGVHVETTGAGTITNSGTCAAIGVTKASGAASWPVGLLFASNAVDSSAIKVESIPASGTAGAILHSGASGSLLATTAMTSAINLYTAANHTSGSHRTVWVETTFGGAASPGGFAIRGYAELKTGITSAATCYMVGVQGKAKVVGTLNGTSEGRVAALFGQLDISTGTYTAGQLSCAWLDCGASAGAIMTTDEFHILRMTNTTAESANSVIYAYAAADYFMALSGPGGAADWIVSGAVGGSQDKKLKLSLHGVDYYIPCNTA